MKQKILHCENCKKETRQLIGNKYSVQNGNKRNIKHCCECGLRIIKNKNKTYSRDYSNKNGISN